MKYVVIGQNRESGARMSLEFEAESKAAAERKATHAGMSVRHVNEVTGEVTGTAPATTTATTTRGVRRARRSGGPGALLRFILLVAIVAALAWYFWPHLRRLMPA